MSTPDTPFGGAFQAPFQAPWQAQLFGLTVALSDAGTFSWPDWTEALGAKIAKGFDYWDAWLMALEAMLAERGLALPDEVTALAQDWQEAAHHTPHGQPILLENASRP